MKLEVIRMDYKLFSERLKKARADKGWSQIKLADAVGVRQNTISGYENSAGEKGNSPKLDVAARIAECLDVSLDWLVGMDKESNESEMTGTDFLKYLIELLKKPKAVLTQKQHDDVFFEYYTDAVTLGDAFDCSTANNIGFSLDVNGLDAHKLYERLNESLTISSKLENCGVPDETISAVVNDMEKKMVQEYGKLFDIDKIPF